MAERVLLYGGTFDPPHNGHMALLKAACEAVRPDVVLVTPTGTPPHKTGGETPAALRLEMCRCFLPVWPGVQLDDTEIRRGGKSYTIDTVETVRARYPGAALYLCLGSDMLLTFHEWRRYRDLLRLAALVVHSRQPGDGDALHAAARQLEAEGGTVVFTGGPVLELSSTELRALLEAGADVSALVPPAVRAVISRARLYQT